MEPLVVGGHHFEPKGELLFCVNCGCLLGETLSPDELCPNASAPRISADERTRFLFERWGSLLQRLAK